MKIFRKRMLPEEMIELKKDELVFVNDEILITRWEALRPKSDLHHGCSCYFLKGGYKVSKFYLEDGTLMYWYCDIISHEYDMKEDSHIFTDLLADVIVYPDGLVKIVDLDELAEAFKRGSLDSEKMYRCLNQLHALLEIIYSGRFGELQVQLNKWEQA